MAELMNLQDLKLLVDVAYHERDGQQGFTVGQGFKAARERLIAGSLLIRNPSQPKETAQVTMTNSGFALLNRLVDRLESGAIVAAIGDFMR